jgi:hypothetical protein
MDSVADYTEDSADALSNINVLFPSALKRNLPLVVNVNGIVRFHQGIRRKLRWN